VAEARNHGQLPEVLIESDDDETVPEGVFQNLLVAGVVAP